MSNIIRRPDYAGGGITEAERQALSELADRWVANAMRTDRVSPPEAADAIKALYRAAGLDDDIAVVVVPSPIVMAAVYGAACALSGLSAPLTAATEVATRDATRAATRAIRDATDDATRAAIQIATLATTRDATLETAITTDEAARDATLAAIEACKTVAGDGGLACTQNWCRAYQGGNLWVTWEAYLAGCRDVLGLDLPEYKNYAAWERCALVAGGFRVMHEKFCIITDYPEILRVDDDHRPHCETGPSHRWRDGWALYHWHGVRVPAHWIEGTPDPAEIIAAENVEQRAAGAEIVGWDKMLAVLDARVVDDSGSEDIGQLIELTLPGLETPGRFLKARCPRNGTIVEGVPYVSDIDRWPIDTALAAQAWRDGKSQSEYQHPPRRT